MTESIQTKLYIKHAVGSRMLLDVSANNKPFVLEQHPTGWLFRIEHVDAETAALLTTNAQELNLFYFVEQSGKIIQKRWFYDKDIPTLSYDKEIRQLTIQLDSMMEYTNDKV